jgi:hypothetical protein
MASQLMMRPDKSQDSMLDHSLPRRLLSTFWSCFIIRGVPHARSALDRLRLQRNIVMTV